uniref:Uncharacterized protein n=1 Tax=Glossina austeni TaxID=7395 RepID=A0A1A9UUT0_GLOAU
MIERFSALCLSAQNLLQRVTETHFHSSLFTAHAKVIGAERIQAAPCHPCDESIECRTRPMLSNECFSTEDGTIDFLMLWRAIWDTSQNVYFRHKPTKYISHYAAGNNT